jgi:hypothetical protein
MFILIRVGRQLRRCNRQTAVLSRKGQELLCERPNRVCGPTPVAVTHVGKKTLCATQVIQAPDAKGKGHGT